MTQLLSSRSPSWVRFLSISIVIMGVVLFTSMSQASANEKSKGRSNAPGQVKKIDTPTPVSTTLLPPATITTPTPSLNGEGKGKAAGKPCAGCVGNADNKTPKGQKPDGSDKNKGFECDKNHGVGKGNPSHSGCGVIVNAASTSTSKSTPNANVSTSTTTTTTPPTSVYSQSLDQANPTRLARTGANEMSNTSLAMLFVAIGLFLITLAMTIGQSRLPKPAHFRKPKATNLV